MIDQALFRGSISRFATGVTVVATRRQDRNCGMTLSAGSVLCLEPGLVGVGITKAMPTRDAVSRSNHFVVNVPAHDQEELARQFARPADKFTGIATSTAANGSPVLADSLMHVECHVADRLAIGPHTLFVGEVDRAQVFEDRRPLVHYGADFSHFHPPIQAVSGRP
ncbi:flavin reductase family protein (plasmid) [Rhodococcus opacus]|uniref:flavin reductase family protein n=1 Tax=Rhodococcus opacus TaxID=37919 RepID=UPI001FF686DB|nr:flavin reductase family protein [Rhodococcus opacus]UOT08507.1 flavin reductase family protein [Rhodococcus opacus]